jgi:hypothetical protein
MSWKRKGGVDRYEGKHASAKVEEFEGSYRLRLLTKRDNVWQDGVTGDREYCKAIGAGVVDRWNESMDKADQRVVERRQRAEEFENLPDNEKTFIRILHMIGNLKKEDRTLAIRMLPENIQTHAIEWCTQLDGIEATKTDG